MFGLTRFASNLHALGFSPLEVARLSVLKQRYGNGAFDEPTDEEKRLAFVRWLIDHGRLSDGEPDDAGSYNRDAA